jgi:hypothetical protein
MGFPHCAADYPSQVWEISAPVPLEGGMATAFGRRVSEVTAAIQRSPAHWEFWGDTSVLADLELIRSSRDTQPTAPSAALTARDRGPGAAGDDVL